MAAAVSLRQFRRHGVDPAARRLTLGLAGVISTLTFAAVAAAGISSPAAIGAVLLYRIMTFKIAGTLTWVLYPQLKRRHPRATRPGIPARS